MAEIAPITVKAARRYVKQKQVMDDIKKVTSPAERKAAWVYHFGRQDWEFHGPDEFYWHGHADNAYDARAKGWQAWWEKLESDAAAMRARLKGQRIRAALRSNG